MEIYKQVNDVVNTLSKLLEESYSSVSKNVTFPLAESLIRKYSDMNIKQQLQTQIITIKRFNEYLYIAYLLEEYHKTINQCKKISRVYRLLNLLRYCEDNNIESFSNSFIQYDSLIEDMTTLERELHLHGISKDWLNSAFLDTTSTKKQASDMSPQRQGESNDLFIKRILGNVIGYPQALKIYVNNISKEDVLLYDNLKSLRACLTSKQLISNITCNELYDDINKILS